MLNRTVAPPSYAVDRVDLVEAIPFVLDNGIRGHYINAGAQPVARLEVIFKAGKLHETHPGVSFFVGKMLLEGTKHISSREVSDFFDGIGAFIEVTPGFDFITVTIHHLRKHLEMLLPVLAELLHQPLFGEEELAKLQQIRRQRLQVDLEKNNFVASRKFRELIFSTQHPYGRSLDFSDINAIEIALLKEHFESKMHGALEIIIAGQVDESDVKLLNKYLGDLPFKNPLSALDHSHEYQPQEYLGEKEESLQSTIRLGMPIVDRHHADYFKIMVVNEILGGYFGSRLMKNIREEKGFTYGIHSAITHLEQGSMFLIGTEVKKSFRAQTIFEIHKEIKQLQKELVPAEELQTVTSYMAGAFASEIDTPFALADKFKTIHFNDLDYSYYQRFFETLKKIDNESLLEISRAYMPLENLSQVVIG